MTPIGLSLGILPTAIHECIQEYAGYLRSKYTGMSVLPEGDWPPSLSSGQYTRQAIIQIEREERLQDAEMAAAMERDYLHGNIDNIVARNKDLEIDQLSDLFTEPHLANG